MPESRACPGLARAREAASLPDLLLSSPPEWLDRPLLRFRMADGEWRAWSRVRVVQAVLRLAAWLEARGVRPGDRVGILGHNSPEWFIADFAILRLGAVSVPAYFTDPAEAVHHVFGDAGVSLALVEPGEQQEKLAGMALPALPFRAGNGEAEQETVASVIADEAWDGRLQAPLPQRDDLATLIYTSGTTGHPKGVMLTHGNILADVEAGLGGVPVWPEDVFLSFLPVSHAFERTVGHFLPTASGAEIAYAEHVTTLMRDLPEVRPSVVLSVPRLYEKIHAGVQAKLAEASWPARMVFRAAQRLGAERFARRQRGGDLRGLRGWLWRRLDALAHAPLREKLGGRLRAFISGGAALHPEIARFLLAADITILPGYGLTEASPVLTVNREAHIRPETVGPALPGVELRLADDGELLARGPMVMRGYWNRPEETKAALDDDGWLHTGDIAEIDADGFVRIVDRKKEIMVLSNGENVPPAIIEQHLVRDPCILQAMVVAEKRPFVAALIVPDEAEIRRAWRREKGRDLPADWRENEAVHAWMLARMRADERDLASFMQVRRFAFVDEEWTQANGLVTPTLKVKRRAVTERYRDLIESLFSGGDRTD